MSDLSYAGYQITLSANLSKRTQKRFPRSKKKRIRLKWEKRDTNYVSAPDMQIYVMEETKTMVMHPAVWAKIEKEVASCGTHSMFSWPRPVHMPFEYFPMIEETAKEQSMFGCILKL